jgi:hypothetical protein
VGKKKYQFSVTETSKLEDAMSPAKFLQKISIFATPVVSACGRTLTVFSLPTPRISIDLVGSKDSLKDKAHTKRLVG